jgi:hypothetical protein
LKYIYYIFFSLFLITLAGESANAQFWKRKKYHTDATSGKITEPDATEYRDAFKRKSSKGPNVKTTRKPFWKSKKKMHQHATTRKTKKRGNRKFFKPKYSNVKLKKKSGDSFSRNARKTKKDARKGGGGGNGVFKGRKK